MFMSDRSLTWCIINNLEMQWYIFNKVLSDFTSFEERSTGCSSEKKTAIIQNVYQVCVQSNAFICRCFWCVVFINRSRGLK